MKLKPYKSTKLTLNISLSVYWIEIYLENSKIYGM